MQNVSTANSVFLNHKARIRKDLQRLGLSTYGRGSMEARYLPNIIHPDEAMGGAVYGRTEDGLVLLVATDRRVVYLDLKPLFLNEDEINYDVVSGVRLTHSALFTTVTLHNRIRDIAVRTHSYASALQFLKFIESQCLERNEVYRW